MKLSEAILLGSTVLAPKAGRQHYSELNAGCALGMAAVAAGYSFRPVTDPFEERDRRTLGTETVWGTWVLKTVPRPCTCWRFRVPREMRVKDIIAHLFDHHIMFRKNWTLEQLAAWVDTVEPKQAVHPPTTFDSRPEPTGFDEQPFRQPRSGPSQEEIDEWQAVREAFESHSDADRTQSRFPR